jgi:hypothetical protein
MFLVIFAFNSVYAGIAMAASAMPEAAPEVHMHMQDDAIEMHGHSMLQHAPDAPASGHHHAQCHDCFACLGMLPLQAIAHSAFKPTPVRLSYFDTLYRSPVPAVDQRPPIYPV